VITDNKKTVFLTGATGLVGSYLLKILHRTRIKRINIALNNGFACLPDRQAFGGNNSCLVIGKYMARN
jgi:FlaA1/EpsC-like NDP-sugar epimerase